MVVLPPPQPICMVETAIAMQISDTRIPCRFFVSTLDSALRLGKDMTTSLAAFLWAGSANTRYCNISSACFNTLTPLLRIAPSRRNDTCPIGQFSFSRLVSL